jgi:transposase InsO family protein
LGDGFYGGQYGATHSTDGSSFCLLSSDVGSTCPYTRWVKGGLSKNHFVEWNGKPVPSVSRSGNVWDNAAMESFFSSLKTERTARKVYRSRDQAKADVFDYIERFYNPKRRPRRSDIKPYGVREAGWISLSGCQQSRVQLSS